MTMTSHERIQPALDEHRTRRGATQAGWDEWFDARLAGKFDEAVAAEARDA